MVEWVDVFQVSQRFRQARAIAEEEGGVRFDEFGRGYLLRNFRLKGAILVVVSADMNQREHDEGCRQKWYRSDLWKAANHAAKKGKIKM